MTLALAGDTMLGRSVADVLRTAPPASLVSPDLVELTRSADLFVLNLECCISDRGEPWPAPGKPFFFRAPPSAVELLEHLGVDAVTLANNHALDYGPQALLDTLGHLQGAGIAVVGAGADEAGARGAAVLQTSDGSCLAVLGLADHPADFAAGTNSPGVAFVDIRGGGLPTWVPSAIEEARSRADAVLVTPHWGPNMAAEPVPHVRRAADELIRAGATLVAGHSAHVFHGVVGRVLYDLGDFLDDYAVDPVLRNDLGLLWLVELDGRGPVRLEAVPLALDYCRTRLADSDQAAWVLSRFAERCAAFGTEVHVEGGRAVIDWGGTAQHDEADERRDRRP
jgi:poly-gamma-glutamate capsule biosynthesis protein CapA/YwtB (metallophosphatase superfamily)